MVADTQTLTWTLNGIAETASNDPSRYCAGASVECWDTNGNSVCDLASEDINGDGLADLRPMQWLGMRVDVPTLSSINLPSLVLTLGALIAVFRFKVGMIKVLLACSALGIVYYLATGATS